MHVFRLCSPAYSNNCKFIFASCHPVAYAGKGEEEGMFLPNQAAFYGRVSTLRSILSYIPERICVSQSTNADPDACQ